MYTTTFMVNHPGKSKKSSITSAPTRFIAFLVAIRSSKPIDLESLGPIDFADQILVASTGIDLHGIFQA